MKTLNWIVVVVAVCFVLGCSGGSSPMVGTWKLEISEEMKKGMPEGMEPPDVTIAMAEDGSWSGSVKMFGQEMKSKGTWKLEEKKLSLTTTEEDGKKVEKPMTETATVADDMKSFELPGSSGQGKMVKQ